ncbi:hypothetical protein Bca4012_009085 [Brassica carinata]|uniref:2-oxoglutarate-dependent dioxygenase DAO n=1 Tax=Brassica carinata TaxID=52824 RepID=A0A8X7S1Q2_BRACI|nr:hypothetical protein Bca52824_034368 [Brassica carinata]
MSDTGVVFPTIDLGELSDEILNQKIREAGERSGCFRVINHGVSLSLMSEMKKTVMDLFERPYEVKVRNTDDVLPGSGYRFRPSETNPNYEALGLYDLTSPQALNTFCDQLDASAEQREIMVKYAEAIHGLAKDLSRRLAESYGLADTTNYFKSWPIQFSINKYHFKPEIVGTVGVKAHTDFGFLTILQDDENVAGFEAMDPSSGTFFSLSPLTNSLAINLGDMATIWSNGRLSSVKHRVRCETKTRFSIVSFLLGPMDTDLEAPSAFVDAEHPRLYKPISNKGIRSLRVTTNLIDGEALKHISYE